MIDESKPKEIKGRNKRKCKRSKITFAELLENIKRRVKRRMLISQIMQRIQDHPQGANMRIGIGKVRILMQHIHILFFGPPMPMSWMPPYAHIDPYSSWDRYDTRAHSPSYFRPSNQYYASLRRSTFEQSHVKDRFNYKESVQSSRKKK